MWCSKSYAAEEPRSSSTPPIRRGVGILMRDKIKLVSSAGTGHYYTTTKNKRTQPEKMEIKKYDPVVRKHVAYKEAKIK